MELESHFRGYTTWDAYFITFPFYALYIEESFLGSSRYILLITVNIYWMLTICRVCSENFIIIILHNDTVNTGLHCEVS